MICIIFEFCKKKKKNVGNTGKLGNFLGEEKGAGVGFHLLVQTSMRLMYTILRTLTLV